MTKLKVALVNPPIAGHLARGTGVYADGLFKGIKKIDGVDITQVDISDNLNSFDLVHFPYFDPFFLTLPKERKYKNIVTVHDLVPLKFPRFFPKGVRGEIKWRIQRFLLKNVSCLLTDSVASQKDITKYTGIPEEKIHVVYLGVDSDFRLVKDKGSLKKTSQKLRLPEEYVLYVGDVNYNKNISTLLKAFVLARKSYPRLELLLIGKGFISETPELAEINNLTEKLHCDGAIHRLGFLDKEDLINIYNQARVYVQPSFAEGFGLPILEAMACGCPTVVSNTSSLPELAGDASMLVSPYGEVEIAAGIETVLKNKVKRVELIEKGLQRIKNFTWEKCAKETINVYRKVIND